MYCRKTTEMVRDLWWRGLPASIRGQIWKLSVANELNITPGNIKISFISNIVNYVSFLKFSDLFHLIIVIEDL